MTATPDPIRRWFLDFLRLEGAEVEEGETLDAVLPSDLVAETGWSELESFAFTPEAASRGARLVSYDSGVLEAVRSVVERGGFSTEVTLALSPFNSSGLESRLAEDFGFVNGVVRMLGGRESMVSYLIAHFRATAVSEEKREALVGTALNLVTGAPVDELVPIVERRLDNAHASPFSSAPDGDRFSKRLATLAARRARAAFAEFEKSLTRRLVRDIERLTDYYGAIAAEIERKIERKQLGGEEALRERSRIEATRRELAGKLVDQRGRYAMTIRIEPIAFLRVRIPVVLLDLRVLRRKRSREVSWAYNPLLRQIERPGCEVCFDPLRQITLCDEKLHILCPHCASAHPSAC
jgi:hypothetical protein